MMVIVGDGSGMLDSCMVERSGDITPEAALWFVRSFSIRV